MTYQALCLQLKTFAEGMLRAQTASDWLQHSELSAAGLYCNVAKQAMRSSIFERLYAALSLQQFETKRAGLTNGALLNWSEQKAASHVLLRTEPNCTALKQLSTQFLPDTEWVHVGIGGSELGPRLLCEAFPNPRQPKVRFLANIDSDALVDITTGLNPQKAAFIIASKSFSTAETLYNLERLQAYAKAHQLDFFQRVVAITAFPDKAKAHGFSHILPFPETVGGRYAIWSNLGFIFFWQQGSEAFEAFLAGAAAIDAHFQTALPLENIPVVLGLLDVWNSSFLGKQTIALLPYAERLATLPLYMQQLMMESLGKSQTAEGKQTTLRTCPVWWGRCGVHGQHAFHQLFFQGTESCHIDFIGIHPPEQKPSRLLEHMIAQSEALWSGPTQKKQSSNTIILPGLTPYALGALLALYEHRAFVASVFWGINPFDQQGVEYGKQLAKTILQQQAKHTLSLETQQICKKLALKSTLS